MRRKVLPLSFCSHFMSPLKLEYSESQENIEVRRMTMQHAKKWKMKRDTSLHSFLKNISQQSILYNNMKHYHCTNYELTVLKKVSSPLPSYVLDFISFHYKKYYIYLILTCSFSLYRHNQISSSST